VDDAVESGFILLLAFISARILTEIEMEAVQNE
jgi:hypothetical protein